MLINPNDIDFIFYNNDNVTATLGLWKTDPITKKRYVVRQIVKKEEADQLSAVASKMESEKRKFEEDTGKQRIERSITDRDLRHYGKNP